jgi:DNA-binding CsgD family transcriptional regulator
MTEVHRQPALLIAIHSDILLPGEAPIERTIDAGMLPATADRSYMLNADRCIIGRSEQECHIRVRPERLDISRKHASIRRQGPRYILEDHSKHGTFVNGQRIHGSWQLMTGDILGFANSHEMLLFEDPKQVDKPFVEPLTKRELEILRLVAIGQSNKEIAGDLNISMDTVKSHLKAIYVKLGVSNRTEAGNVARRRGLLTVPPE